MIDDGPPTLSSGALTLVLAPAIGGSIARFEYASPSGLQIPLLCGVEGNSRSVLDHGSFPLVPYCNRIRDGRFSFRGREVRIANNMTGDASPLHGDGWLAAWDVARLTANEAELRYAYRAGEWPWAYEARQLFALDPNGLTLALSCTNRSAEPMPCGLGHHPYFHCTAATTIDTEVESAWTIDEKVLPVAKVPAEGRYDLRNRKVCGQGLDNGFGDWSGRASIHDPSLPIRIELSSADASFFQLYSPAAGGVFVAEPVSHANAALNAPEAEWEELGLRVLDPGETMSVTMRLDIVPVQ
jgi:aldose 1-epimerase